MAIRFVKYIGASLRTAIFTGVVVILHCGCRSKTEAVGSTTVVIPSISDSGALLDTDDAGARIRQVPDPIVGFRFTQPPHTDEYPRVSTDGDIVAVWTQIFEDPDEEDGPHALYLLAKRIDTDEEIKRLLLEYPLGSPPVRRRAVNQDPTDCLIALSRKLKRGKGEPRSFLAPMNGRLSPSSPHMTTKLKRGVASSAR